MPRDGGSAVATQSPRIRRIDTALLFSLRPAFAVFTTILGASCVQKTSDANRAWADGENRPALVNGYTDPGSYFPWVGVVNGCSATLVGRRTAITAAHCIGSSGQLVTFCTPPCGNINNCSSECMNGIAYIHPSYNGPGKCGSGGFDYDIAVVNLDGDFYTSFSVMPQQLGGPASTPSVDEPLTLVGFGCTIPDTSTGDGQRRYGYNVVGDFGSQTIDYDDTSQAYGCRGDSGGPAFFGGSNCVQGVIVGETFCLFDHDYELTRVDTKISWIQSTSGDSSVHPCGVQVCGDGLCQPGEDCSTCPQDCGVCPPCNPPCGANQTCLAGNCVCAYNQCGAICCVSGEDFCCSGQCSSRCGGSCPC